MRKISLIIVAFLLVLYITPMIFISSSVGVAIPAEPNMNKDFSLSEYGDESPQSITHFEETLPDNVLHYPDTFYGPPVYATDGERWPNPTGFLSNTYVDNSDSFGATSYSTAFYSCNVTMTFEEMTYDEGLYYHFKVYSHAYNNASSFWILKYHCESHSSQWELLETLSSGTLFTYSDTLFSDKYIIDGNVTFMLKATTAGAYAGCYVNYACVGSPIMTLADSDHYAESFYNVSDWSGYGTEGADSFTSDDDLGTLVFADADNADYWQTSASLGVITGHYIEVYAKYNTSAYGSKVSWLLLKGGLVGAGGSSAQDGVVTATGSWNTDKVLITSTDTITGVAFYCGDATGPYEVEFDYLQIGPADEMGWQHDCSTTTGVSSSDGGTISSDGDKITLTADADGATFIIVADTTTTATSISTTYYPFLHFEITGGSSTWSLEQYDGSAYATLQSSTSLTTGAKRFNMQSLDTYVEKWRITLSNSGTMISDFLQAYSIANFTLTLLGDTINDYLYVDSGILYSNIDTGYIEANYDPVLSVSDTYSVYNLTTSGTAPEFSQYVSSWSSYSANTRGATTSGTLTDIKLKFDSTEIISEIKFIDDRHWRSVEAVTIYFNIPLFTGSFDALLIMLGLVMIPASTLYFVKGGRSEMSTDKLFYVLIVFVMGWGLFLGGIFG